MNRSIQNRTVFTRLFAGCLLTSGLCGASAGAQSTSPAPMDIDFAGVTVHLTEPGRQRVQQELNHLYANRNDLRRDVEALRELTPLLEPLFTAKQLSADFRYAVFPLNGDEKAPYWNVTVAQSPELGLLINSSVDERYHPVLATQAVTSRINYFYKQSGNSVRALLQYYQTSQTPISDIGLGKTTPTDVVLDAQSSPPAIWKVLARKLAFEREEPLNRPLNPYIVFDYRQGGGQSVQSMARQLRLDQDRFAPFNTWLLGQAVPATKEYPVLIRVLADEFPDVHRLTVRSPTSGPGQPTDVGFPVLVKLPVQETILQRPAFFYAINDKKGIQAQSCDNVITLSYFGNTDIQSFLKYNDLSEQDIVQPGQIYYLARKAKRAKVPFHVVQRNQTLREVAYTYGVRLESLLRFNRIQPTQRIQTGRIIWLQRTRPRRRPIEYRQLPSEETPVPQSGDPTVAVSAPLASPRDSLVLQTPVPRQEPKPVTQPVDTLTIRDTVRVATAPIKEPDTEPNEQLKLHVVKPGQTYSLIAKLYGVSLQQLYTWNNLSERVPLEVGQELIVAVTRPQPAKTEQPPKSNPAGTTVAGPNLTPAAVGPVTPGAALRTPAERISYHTVKPGQTVYRVALINNVSIPDLMRWNKLTNYSIAVGQRLIIRKPIK